MFFDLCEECSISLMGLTAPQVICHRNSALGSLSGSVLVLGFGASHAEVAEVLLIAPAMVDFGFGSAGIMYTVDRQDLEAASEE